jgi:hypothetical protein
MIVYLICGAIAGAALSLRFNVMILVPGMLLGIVIAGVSGVAAGESIRSILGTMAVLAGAMQVGYLAAGAALTAKGNKRINGRRDRSMPPGFSRPI